MIIAIFSNSSWDNYGAMILNFSTDIYVWAKIVDPAESKRGKRKSQGAPQRQAAVLTPNPPPDTKRKRKRTKPNMCKPNKCTKSTKTSFPLPAPPSSSGEAIATPKGLKKPKNKTTQDKTQNKSHRRINHKATSKINTGTIAQKGQQNKPPGASKHIYTRPISSWVPMLLLKQKYIKIRFA